MTLHSVIQNDGACDLVPPHSGGIVSTLNLHNSTAFKHNIPKELSFKQDAGML